MSCSDNARAIKKIIHLLICMPKACRKRSSLTDIKLERNANGVQSREGKLEVPKPKSLTQSLRGRIPFKPCSDDKRQQAASFKPKSRFRSGPLPEKCSLINLTAAGVLDTSFLGILLTDIFATSPNEFFFFFFFFFFPHPPLSQSC